MTLRPCALLLAAAVLAALPHGRAHAEGEVPDVSAKDLPVAGTSAPIEGSGVTRVLAGALGGFRVDGAPEVLDEAGLVAVLRQRAGGGSGLNRHTVWVTMAAAEPFLPMRDVIQACAQAGIFRVGLEVQDEKGAAGLGFPFFLPGPPPAPDPANPAPKARRLRVQLDRWDGAPSNPRRLYAAAKVASERFAPVVAEVSLDVNLSVQHAVTCLDMLYRGGVVGVKVRFRAPLGARASRTYDGPDTAHLRPGEARRAVATSLLAKVEERQLGATEPNVDLPPIAPRTQPWGDDGANAPGLMGLTLEDLPAGPAAGREEHERDDGPLPSYAGRREGAPTSVIVAADRAVSGWAAALGTGLKEALNRRWTLTESFVSRLRDADRFGAWFEPLVSMFPGTERVVPSTLRLDVYLLKGTAVVGKVETTLNVAGSALSFIYARWVNEQERPADLALPPAAADPFAAGVPGHVRVWLEAAFATVYRQGATGLVLAPANEVLAQLPTVAHENSAKGLAARGTDFDVLAKWLQVTEYDRLLVLPRGATAAVHAQGRVAGILQYGLESEERELRLSSITGRAAPR